MPVWRPPHEENLDAGGREEEERFSRLHEGEEILRGAGEGSADARPHRAHHGASV